MAFHPETFAIKQYIQETYPQFVNPIDTVLLAHWQPGEEIQNGEEIISISFSVLALYLTNIDGDISKKEIDFFRDIYDLFNEQDFNVSSESLLNAYKASILDNSGYYSLMVPYAILYLDAYDQSYGTRFAETARTMFFRFANAFIKADGKIT